MALGRKTGGRRRGTPNKRTVGLLLARQALGAGGGGAPFDALMELRAIAQHFLEQADAERRKAKPCRRAIKQSLEQAARVLSDIVPYERAKLSAVKVDVAPLNLACLTDSELAFLRRIRIKVAVQGDRAKETEGRLKRCP